jgi:hypothetical protein
MYAPTLCSSHPNTVRIGLVAIGRDVLQRTRFRSFSRFVAVLLDQGKRSRHCWAAFSGETEMQIDLHNTAQIFAGSVSAFAAVLLLIRAWVRRRAELFKDRGATRARATD